MREGPIVVGVDGSPESLSALHKTVDLVREQRATGGLDLVVVFVRQPGWASGAATTAQVEVLKALDEVQADVEREVHHVLDGVFVTWRMVVRAGDPAHELIKEAEEVHASGIAVGGHKHSTIGAVLVHSVDASLVHAYHGSLFIVRDTDAAPIS
jgi:nucleotide-binding universal stress UspA family protein